MSLRKTKQAPSTPKKRSVDEPKADKTKKAKAATSADDSDPSAAHVNDEVVLEWKLPSGVQFLDLFNAKMPALKGWPVLTDTRIPRKQSRTHSGHLCASSTKLQDDVNRAVP